MREDVVVWYNADCSKCRAVRDLLESARIQYRLRSYLDDPPARRELAEVIAQLGVAAREIARTRDAAWQTLDVDEADDDAVLDALVENPALIERPIAILGDRAVIARPPERIRELV